MGGSECADAILHVAGYAKEIRTEAYAHSRSPAHQDEFASLLIHVQAGSRPSACVSFCSTMAAGSTPARKRSVKNISSVQQGGTALL